MYENIVGPLLGLARRGTITKYNGNGTVVVKLDDVSELQEDCSTHTVDLPIAYADSLGAFIGGFPEVGTPVYVEQMQSEWRISGFAKPDNTFSTNTTSFQGALFDEAVGDMMEEFGPGRILIQSRGKESRILVDRNDGIFIGNPSSSMHFDPSNRIISHNYPNEYAFTSAHRKVIGEVCRDLEPNVLRNVEGSSLTDHNYPTRIIGMDPDQETSTSTTGGTIRNLPLVESREVTYELASINSIVNFTRDQDEIEKYDINFTPTQDSSPLRTDSRANTFNLNLHSPNHLIEEIKGTGVDTFGNILDLNRSAISIGGLSGTKASFQDNEDLVDAFKQIRAKHRRSLAYHFEINARKQQVGDEVFEVPASDDIKDNMGRFLSTFFVDIDKEGQFKMNVPCSSETGNIPLPVRYVSSTVLEYEAKELENPNYFAQEDDFIDIFLEDFSVAGRFESKSQYQSKKGIELIGEEGSVGPIDVIKGKNSSISDEDAIIHFNTPFHNILDAGFVFTKDFSERNRNAGADGDGIVRRPVGARLNTDGYYGDRIQRDYIVSDQITVTGDNANAGGRSGSINLDGFLQLGIGANTVDRQSLWLDTAGGIVSTIGRDKTGISYCASLDGDMLIQIGGPSIGTSTDSRFSSENDANRTGALDIRVMKYDGQVTVIRVDGQGVNITSFGRVTIESQQDMTLRARGQLSLEGEVISFHEGGLKSPVLRNGVEK